MKRRNLETMALPGIALFLATLSFATHAGAAPWPTPTPTPSATATPTPTKSPKPFGYVKYVPLSETRQAVDLRIRLLLKSAFENDPNAEYRVRLYASRPVIRPAGEETEGLECLGKLDEVLPGRFFTKGKGVYVDFVVRGSETEVNAYYEKRCRMRITRRDAKDVVIRITWPDLFIPQIGELLFSLDKLGPDPGMETTVAEGIWYNLVTSGR